MQAASTTVSTTMKASRQEAFLHIVPIDLPSIFTGHGPLPSVTSHEYPDRFAYRITEFTGPLRFLASEARGDGWFETPPGHSATTVRWRYEFISRSVLLAPLVALFTHGLWRRYMARKRCVFPKPSSRT